MKDCTFKPAINKKKKEGDNPIENVKRLYEEGMEKLSQKKEKEKQESEKYKELYSFKPEIHPTYEFI